MPHPSPPIPLKFNTQSSQTLVFSSPPQQTTKSTKVTDTKGPPKDREDKYDQPDFATRVYAAPGRKSLSPYYWLETPLYWLYISNYTRYQCEQATDVYRSLHQHAPVSVYTIDSSLSLWKSDDGHYRPKHVISFIRIQHLSKQVVFFSTLPLIS
jgi:hypothetical protein